MPNIYAVSEDNEESMDVHMYTANPSNISNYNASSPPHLRHILHAVPRVQQGQEPRGQRGGPAGEGRIHLEEGHSPSLFRHRRRRRAAANMTRKTIASKAYMGMH